ncbi:MAG: phosphotransferase [Myxococcales bacterium]|nr:phosphotransferase [Myxococcales bacterium]
MRPGGLLDGFPIHLLAGEDADAPVVVLDAIDLGRLVVAPVPGAGAKSIALSRELAALRATREGWDDALAPAPLLVCADPAHPPFRDASIGGLVGREDAAERWSGCLGARGFRAVVETPGEWNSTPSDRTTTWIRPASGREYFATSSWNPRRWPFASIQLGRARQAELIVSRLLSRLPLSRLHDGVRLRVAGNTTSRLDAWWARDADRSDATGLFVKVAWNALLFGADAGRRIAKFPLIDVAAARMQEHATNLASLDVDTVVAKFVPHVLERGSAAGQEFQVENVCAGAPATRVPWWPRPGGWGAAWKRTAATEAVAFLLDLHAESQCDTTISRDLFEQFLKPQIDVIERDARRLEASFQLTDLCAALWSVFGDRVVPLVRTHGDFWPGNLLVDRAGHLTGVLDWDASAERGWPLLDLLQLLAFQHKRRAFWHFGATLDKRLAPRRLAPFEDALAAQYCGRLGIPLEDWSAYVALYWLERASQWLVTDFHEGKRNDGWLRRNVLDAKAPLLERLRASGAGAS